MPLGAMTCQNILWLTCPPPWLRTAARIASGWLGGRLPPVRLGERDAGLETAYCAALVLALASMLLLLGMEAAKRFAGENK